MTSKRFTLLAAGTLLLATLAGCTPQPDSGTNGNTMTTTTSTKSSPAAMVSSAASAAAASPEAALSGSPVAASSGSPVVLDASNGTSVQITVDDSELKMPSALPAGRIGFVVNNGGKAKHNVEIKGGDVDKKLDAPIEPGASQTLEVDLKVGTYEVTDPDNTKIKYTLEVK